MDTGVCPRVKVVQTICSGPRRPPPLAPVPTGSTRPVCSARGWPRCRPWIRPCAPGIRTALCRSPGISRIPRVQSPHSGNPVTACTWRLRASISNGGARSSRTSTRPARWRPSGRGCNRWGTPSSASLSSTGAAAPSASRHWPRTMERADPMPDKVRLADRGQTGAVGCQGAPGRFSDNQSAAGHFRGERSSALRHVLVHRVRAGDTARRDQPDGGPYPPRLRVRC
jgi:hypothetical protein